MSKELFEALELLEKEKGIPVDYMLEKVEAALVSAYKRESGSTSARVGINREKRQLKLYRMRTVVEEVIDPKSEISLEEAQKISRRYVLGSTVEDEVKTKNFGRLSAQTAKQVIVQGIREAEKSNILRDYEKKREEIISAVVVKSINIASGNPASQKRVAPLATGVVPHLLKTNFSKHTAKPQFHIKF